MSEARTAREIDGVRHCCAGEDGAGVGDRRPRAGIWSTDWAAFGPARRRDQLPIESDPRKRIHRLIAARAPPSTLAPVERVIPDA